jgi:uncharacterized protein (TIGR00725 family)
MESMLRRLPIVAVFGQGTPVADDQAQLARDAGGLVARLGAHLLTGGGYGVMEAASQGFVAVAERPGFCIGIVPRDPAGPFDRPHQMAGRRYPNRFVEIVIMTPLPSLVDDWRNLPARNHVNVLSADAAIVLPGNAGTHNELDMLAEYYGECDRQPEDRRTVLIGPANRFSAGHRELFLHARDLDEAERHVRRVLAVRRHVLEHQP